MKTPSDRARADATVDPGPRGRRSWIPFGGMIATRFMELRKRRGLMITLIVLTIGLPTLFLTIRLLLHAIAPHSYGPAGSYAVFNDSRRQRALPLRLHRRHDVGMYGRCSIDLNDGMFTHLVITGRSR